MGAFQLCCVHIHTHTFTVHYQNHNPQPCCCLLTQASHRSTGDAQPSRADLLAHNAALLQQLATSRDDTARLQEHVDALTAELQSTREDAEARCAELQAALDGARARAAEAVAQQAEAAPVAGRVAELQAQVKMLQAVAGYAVDQSQEGEATLEAMLLEKNRHLERELAMARVTATDATGTHP